MNCPACNSELYESFYPNFSGTCVSSDFSVVPNHTLDNRICKDCGLIFNAQGVRDSVENYYKESYKLMTFGQNAEIKTFTEKGPQSQAEKSCDAFLEMVNPQANAKVLEAGAGKGHFSTHLKNKRPDIEVEAFEPSESYSYLAQNLPTSKTYHCSYDEFSGTEDSYDVLVSLGVLEHVSNPLDMLKWKRKLLKNQGVCFFRVPDFSRNPNDVFTVDHLSKLTVPSIKNLAARAGFEIIDIQAMGIATHVAMIAKDTNQRPINAFEENIDVVRSNEKYAIDALQTVAKARQAAEASNTKWAIFGQAASGLFAPFALEIDPSEIAAYVDENKSVWGSEIHGRPLIGPHQMELHGIKHIALVISPVYHEQVRARLEPLGVNVYTPNN